MSEISDIWDAKTSAFLDGNRGGFGAFYVTKLLAKLAQNDENDVRCRQNTNMTTHVIELDRLRNFGHSNHKNEGLF